MMNYGIYILNVLFSIEKQVNVKKAIRFAINHMCEVTIGNMLKTFTS